MNNHSTIDLANNNKVKIKFLIIYFIDTNILIKMFVIVNISLTLINILIYISFFLLFLLSFLIILKIIFSRTNINIKLMLSKFKISKKI